MVRKSPHTKIKSAEHLTVKDLKKEASEKKIKGRSKMNRQELCKVLGYNNCQKRKTADKKIIPVKRAKKDEMYTLKDAFHVPKSVNDLEKKFPFKMPDENEVDRYIFTTKKSSKGSCFGYFMNDNTSRYYCYDMRIKPEDLEKFTFKTKAELPILLGFTLKNDPNDEKLENKYNLSYFISAKKKDYDLYPHNK